MRVGPSSADDRARLPTIGRMTESQARTEGWPAHRVTGVDVWPYRLLEETPEFLMLHRSGRSGAPFWQGVSGWIEAGEVPHLAALRELREETGLEAAELYTVDAVFDLYAWKRGTVDAIVPFAALVAAEAEPVCPTSTTIGAGNPSRRRCNRPGRAAASGPATHFGGSPGAA